jgi:hypothetical protein
LALGALVLGSLLCATSAFSQADSAQAEAPAGESENASAAGTDGVAESNRGARLFGQTELFTHYTDNAFFQLNSRDKDDATGLFLRPSVSYVSTSPRLAFASNLNGTFAIFNLPGQVDDYNDFGGSAGVKWDASAINHLSLRGGLNRGHDLFGLERTAATGTQNRSLDKWTQERYELLHILGSPRSRLTLETRLSSFSRTYYTNRVEAVGCGTECLGFGVELLQMTGLYRYSPKTSFLLDALGANVHMERDFPGVPSRNANEYILRGGVQWLATAKTSGDFRVGYVTRDFEAPGTAQFPRNTRNHLDWQISAKWAPANHTTFQLNTARQSVESYNTSSFIETSSVGASWNEEWTARLRTGIGLRFLNADFIGTDRSDDIYEASATIDYLLNRRLALFGLYEYGGRRSVGGSDDFSYDRSVVTAGIKVTY